MCMTLGGKAAEQIIFNKNLYGSIEWLRACYEDGFTLSLCIRYEWKDRKLFPSTILKLMDYKNDQALLLRPLLNL